LIEVEIKAKISNPNSLKEKFKYRNGKYKLSLHHEDTYFNMPNELRDFKKTDEALRVRKSVEYQGNIQDSTKKINYFMTYKGKKIDSLTKSRKELEVKVNEGEDLIEMLKILGFREIFTVIKERDLFEFNYKNNIIEALIDYIPILKEHFLEVEIITESTEKLDATRELLFEFLNLFDIGKNESIRKSYLELIIEARGI